MNSIGIVPCVIVRLSVLAAQPRKLIPAYIRRTYLARRYRLELRSLTASEFNGPLGIDLDTQEIWLERLIFRVRSVATFGHLHHGDEFAGVIKGWPATIAGRAGVPAEYLNALAATGQVRIYAGGVIFPLKPQSLRS